MPLMYILYIYIYSLQVHFMDIDPYNMNKYTLSIKTYLHTCASTCFGRLSIFGQKPYDHDGKIPVLGSIENSSSFHFPS